MSSAKPAVPEDGAKITLSGGRIAVPDNPIVPFIEGDGTGPDIWRASQLVFDAAVRKAYGGRRQIAWMEVYAGEKAFNQFKDWLPDETVTAFKEFLVGIKGPLTTPIGGGIRSLNVALRQLLDLYVCLRPVRWFKGVPSPVKRPDKVDMVIFRENTEDIYAGLEFEAGTAENKRLREMLAEFGGKWAQIREDSGLGIKPVSETGSKRLIRAALNYSLKRGRKKVTLARLCRTAYSMAARTRRFDPVSDTGLMPTPESGRIFQPKRSCSMAMRSRASWEPSSTSSPA